MTMAQPVAQDGDEGRTLFGFRRYRPSYYGGYYGYGGYRPGYGGFGGGYGGFGYPFFG